MAKQQFTIKISKCFVNVGCLFNVRKFEGNVEIVFSWFGTLRFEA